MLKTGLEFAPGTTDECKQIVGKLFPSPAAILSAYRTARETYRSSDIVLVASDQSSDIAGGTRMEYAAHLKRVFGRRASEFRLWGHSAQSVVKLPKDSEAIWLVIDVSGSPVPLMCVIYAIPYSAEAVGAN